MASKADAIQSYLFGKDGNRPFLLNDAFTEDATVQMDLKTDRISFPSLLTGRDAIVDTLVRKFNQEFENIYTLCIGDRPEVVEDEFSCHWMVVMTQKEDSSLRVGCGTYDWNFDSINGRVKFLVITIDIMETAPSSSINDVLAWISNLAYPWCELSKITKSAPNNPSLLRVLQHLQNESTCT